MSAADFLRGKFLFIASLMLTAGFAAFLLRMLNEGIYFTLLLPCVFLVGGFLSLLPEYLEKRAYYRGLRETMARLEEKRFLAEIIRRPHFREGEILYDVLKSINKSCNDELGKYSLSSLEYREYIELWVHEIKTPIAGAKLICENSQNRAVLTELDRIEFFVEQALFYSRSSNVERDYLIKEMALAELVRGALRGGARYLIAHKIKASAEDLDYAVFTDGKWLTFILRQLLDNAVKYGGSEVRFWGRQNAQSVSLFLGDNGIGIPERELSRVFDKGFTGENGRRFGRATGLGLYLCKKLCLKLGLGITLSSRPGEGTVAEIVFPKSDTPGAGS
ncbi:MAG: sensor histidine kinase [Peptococcaceae bacterium]|jgi:signal transduction histidine kinase|nr:sensor histidine kinase [Peptococcaceae bacterium]